MKKFINKGQHFMNGNYACVEAAILAGCRFYGGYPITPSSEILEGMSARLPEVGGHFIEMEDEIGSIAAVLGASNAGLKAMTATSGPGFSLMQEGIGLAMITETPCVIVDEMRAGPSTGIPTRVSQGDVMQGRWGTHGDVETIAYAPNSVQEMFDLTIEAFNQSENYRQPVFIMADQVVGHMSEKIVINDPDEYHVTERITRNSHDDSMTVFDYSRDFTPMFLPGKGFHGMVDSLSHDERGYPSNSPEVGDRMMGHLLGKIRNNRDKIVRYEEFMLEDADIVIVAYGILSRVAERVVTDGRKNGLKIGMFRPVTLWPFPDHEIERLSENAERIVVAEINYGQYSHPVREYSRIPVEEIHFIPAALPSPEAMLRSVLKSPEPRAIKGGVSK